MPMIKIPTPWNTDMVILFVTYFLNDNNLMRNVLMIVAYAYAYAYAYASANLI